MPIPTITSNFTLKAFMAFCLVAMSPYMPMLILVGALLVVDFFTGVYASYRKKVPFESHKLKKTLEKFVFYSVAIICAIFFQQIFMEGVILTKIVAGFIASIELVSIYENIKNITGIDINSRIKGYIKGMFVKKNK